MKFLTCYIDRVLRIVEEMFYLFGIVSGVKGAVMGLTCFSITGLCNFIAFVILCWHLWYSFICCTYFSGRTFEILHH